MNKKTGMFSKNLSIPVFYISEIFSLLPDYP